MKKHELSSIYGEINQVKSLLDSLDDSEFLNKMSLRSRLENLNSLAERLEKTKTKATATSRIFFRGTPVLGTTGIIADFATKAMGAFTDSITAVSASLNSSLPLMGPIPNRQDHQLMITDIVRGSFGFKIEEHSNELDLDCESSISKAMELTSSLIESSITDDDDQLSEIASEIDNRALVKIRAFMKVVCDSNATFTIKNDNKEINVTSTVQLRKALERLSEDNIRESEETFEVIFKGSIPHRRTFEFVLKGSEEWLHGKIDPSLDVSDEINRNIHKPASATMHTTKIGHGKTKYRLVRIPDWD